jgi:hypothetical protein
MAIRIQLRRDTAANWTSVNPVLANGEMGIETDTLKAKVGNGSAAWSARPYINVLPSELAELSQDAVNSAIVAGTGLDKTYNDESNTITLDIDSTVATKAFAAQLLTNANKSNIVITGDETGLTITAENGVADSTTDNLTEGSTNKYFTDERAQDAVGNSLGSGLKYNDSTGAISPDLAISGGLYIESGNKLAVDGFYVTFNGAEQTLTNKTLTSPKVNENVVLTATSSELNILDGATLSTTELNYVDGVTSAIQTQIDSKASLSGATFTGAISGTSLTLSGDLTVNGTTTNINSTNLTVEDKNIILGDTATPTDATADGGGITLKGSTDKTLAWSDATDSWTSSENVNLASGKSYNLNGTNIKDVSETLTNKTLTSPIITSPTVSGLYLSDNSVTFEGQGGDDQFETILSVENPTADRTIVLPNASDTLVGKATTDTLTNKTLTLPKINENAQLTATSSELNILDGATVSTTELNYVYGVTSSVQDQLDTKSPSESPTFTGTVVLPSTTSIGDVSATEISYVNGVTSSIQTQINTKAPSEGATFTGTITLPSTTSIGDVSAAELSYVNGVTSSIQDQLDDKQEIVSGVSSTEIGYLNGVTSLIQDQLDSKLPKAGGTMSGAIAMGNNNITGLGTPSANDHASTKGYVDSAATGAFNDAVSDTDEKIGDPTIDGTAGNTVTSRINSARTESYDYTDQAILTLGNTVTSDYVPLSIVAQPDGVASLDSSGYVPLSEINPDVVVLSSGYIPVAELDPTVVITTGSQTLTNKTLTNPKINEDVAMIATATELNYVNDVTSPIQTQLDSKLNLSGGTMTGALTLSAAPTSDLHAATKLYVDNVTAGINFHESVHAASISNLATIYNNGTSGVGATLTADTNRAFSTLDGESVVLGQRVLIKNQTDSKQNGIYTLTTVGSGSAPWVLTRATDADNNPAGEMKAGDFVFVQNGTINASIGYINNSTANPIVIGTSNITYTEFNAGKTVVAGTGLTEATPGTISIDTSITANLSAAQTLTNKTISGASNTLTNIPNISLVNDSITIGTVTAVLGDTISSIEGLTSVSATTFNGNLSGNATTATNGVVTTGSYTDPAWLTITKTKVGLSNVENTALSTWAGTASITTVGTITTGTWTGNTIAIANGGTGATNQPGAANAILPTQTTHTDKFLKTDGTNVSWAQVPAGYFAPTLGSTLLESGTTYPGLADLLLSDPVINNGEINYPTITSATIDGATITTFAVVPTPTQNTHATTKLYVDTKANAEATAAAAAERTYTEDRVDAERIYIDDSFDAERLYTDGRLSSERTYTNERLEVVPLDDVSTNFNGSNSRFVPKVGGSQITISNPLRLLVNINGIIQILGNQDNHWLSPIAPDGFYIDGDGYIQFTEPVPEGSTFDARLMPGKTSNTLEKSRYPFRATDILLGA